MTNLAPAASTPKERRFFGIRRRFVLLVLATLLPFVILTIFNLAHRVTAHRIAAQEGALARSRIISARVDDLFNNVDTLLLALPHLVSTNKADTDKNNLLLRSIKKDLPSYINNISIWTTKGKNIGSTVAGMDRAAADVSDRKYFRLAIENRGLGVGEPVISRATKTWTIALARPVFHPDDQNAAVVSISIQLEKFQDLLDPADLPPGSVISLLTDQGIVAARTGEPGKWIGKSLFHLPWLKEAIHQREGTKEVVGTDGVTRLSGYTTARKAPWLIYVGIPTEIALADQKTELWLGIGLGGLSLVFALIIAWLISRRITTPILRLTQDTAILASGNLTHRSNVEATSEVGVLAENFNRMAAALESRSSALEQSEGRLRTIIETEPECVKVIAPDGKVLEMNAAGLRIIEVDSLSDVQHRPVLEFVAPEHHEAFLALHNQVMQGESGILEFEIIGRKGTRRWLDTHAVPLRNHGQEVEGLIGISRDITERKRAQEAMRAHYQELQTLSDISQQILNSLDLQVTLNTILDKVMSIGQFDLGLIRLHNKTSGMLEPLASQGFHDPKNVRSLRRPAKPMSTDTILPQVMTGRKTLPLESLSGSFKIPAMRREGIQSILYVPILTEKEVLGVLQLGSRTPRKFSLSEIRLLETIGNHLGLAVQKARIHGETQQSLDSIRALHEINLATTSTLNLETLLEILLEKIDRLLPYSASGIRVVNRGTGKFDRLVTRNIDEKGLRAAQAKSGGGISDTVIRNRASLVINNVQTDSKSALADFFSTHSLVSYLGLPLIAKGEILGTLSLLTKEEHQFSHAEVEFLTTLAGQAAIAIHNSQLYEQRQIQAIELEKANKAKDEFLGFVSHELKTPVNTISGYTQLMLDRMVGEITQEQEQTLGQMSKETGELLAMINSLLQATRIQAGAAQVETAEICLVDFLHDLRSAYQFPLGKEITIEWNWPPDLPTLKTDREKLKHILQNLINNAIKFTEQGQVIISTRVLAHPKAVEFKVEDTGVGIPEDSLSTIFEMFRQVDGMKTRPPGGIGLGLYIVKKFTELLGGRVDVESEPGKGSTFSVILPLEPPHGEKQAGR